MTHTKNVIGSMKRLLWLAALFMSSVSQAAPIEAWTLPNGARVLLVESHAVPIVNLSVNLDAGSRRDPQDKSGVAGMTCAMLERGIRAAGDERAYDEAAFSDALADVATELECSIKNDRAVISLRSLSSQAELHVAVKLAGRMLAHPDFPSGLLAREKARSIAGIKESDTQPAAIADRAFWKAMYGAHPYGNLPTVDSVERISQADLRDFHEAHYRSNRAVIAIVGDVTRDQANVIALELTRRLPQAERALPVIPPVKKGNAREVRMPHPASQAHILIGMPALMRGDPDYYAVSVGNYILGSGGFVSRLVNEVREKRGMAYSVNSSFSPMKQEGPFRISLQTKKEQSDEAIAVVRKTLERFLREGPTNAELKAAKDNMIGGFSLYIDTNSKMLANVSVIGYYDVPLDYLDTWKQKVAKVTSADVRAAFKRKLDLERMSTVIVGAPK